MFDELKTFTCAVVCEDDHWSIEIVKRENQIQDQRPSVGGCTFLKRDIWRESTSQPRLK